MIKEKSLNVNYQKFKADAIVQCALASKIEGGTKMSFVDLAMSRRSIRKFKSKQVSNEDLMTILQSAIYSPSAGNCQSWHFYVVKDEEIRRKIVSNAGNQSFILSAPVIIVVCADKVKSAERYGERGEALYCIQDTAAATQNILLCAKDLGLGACWCGDFDEDEISQTINLEANMRPVAIIPIGYPNVSPRAPERIPMDNVVTFVGENIEMKTDTNKPRRWFRKK